MRAPLKDEWKFSQNWVGYLPVLAYCCDVPHCDIVKVSHTHTHTHTKAIKKWGLIPSVSVGEEWRNVNTVYPSLVMLHLPLSQSE